MSPSPGIRFGSGLLLGSDGEVGLVVTKSSLPAPHVLTGVGQHEPDHALLGELADVNQFVGEQGAVAAGASVVAQQDERSDRHPVGAVGQHRNFDHTDLFGSCAPQDVVSDQFRTLESTHAPTVELARACPVPDRGRAQPRQDSTGRRS